MKCLIHENRQAEGTCVSCGKPFCKECLVELDGKYYCKKHVAELIKANTQKPPIHNEHVPNMGSYQMHPYSLKSKTVTLLLCIFLGALGIHRFYVGKTGSGILYLLTGGLFGIGWIIDIIKLIFGTFTDGKGYYLK